MDQKIGSAVIDFGSTATRTCIVVTQTKLQEGPQKKPPDRKREVVKTYYVQELRANNDENTRFERGEYPSVCCPFDGPPFHVGFDAANQSAKRVISLKSIPYFRTMEHDRHPFTEALYSHYRSLPSEAARNEFNKTLDDMLLEFFTSIVKRIIEKSESDVHAFKLRSIALCIPNTWSAREINIQGYLGPILDKTIAGHDVEVLFTFEAQAQVQFMLHCHADHLRTFDYLMVLDFGGHSMGGSHGELRWGDGKRPRFFSPPDSDFGVRGGYEIWELRIGHYLEIARLRHKLKIQDKDWHIVKSALLKEFYRNKKKTDYQNSRRLKVELDEILDPSGFDKNHTTYTILLPAEKVERAWELAFRDAINMAKDNILRVMQNNKDILVILSGGSIENTRARQEIVGFCRHQSRHTNANIDCKFISENVEIVFLKWTVALGGAQALADTMDVEEFFDKGGALALRMSTKAGKWAGGHAQLLYCKERGAERTEGVGITISGDKKCTIIADPLYRQPQEGANKVFIQGCYDILDLCLDYEPTTGAKSPSRIPEGRYTFEVAKMVYAGTDAILTVRLRPRFTRASTKQASRRSERTSNNHRTALHDGKSLILDIPLASNGSNNLVELDIDLIKGSFWRIEESRNDTATALGKTRLKPGDGGLDAPPAAKRLKADGVIVART